jgi:hypothetical protein
VPRILPILFTFCAFSCALSASYSGGSGLAGDPYLVANSADLVTLSANAGDWGMCFRQTADISAAAYVPVTLFTGVFDGGGYNVTGFACSTGAGYVGFFGKVNGSAACVRNFHLFSPTVNVPSANYVGAIAGSVTDATIKGCTVTWGTVSGYNQTGGITGWNNGGSIVNCSCSASVSGSTYVGGLVGRNEQNSSITDCDVSGTVSSGADYIGGVVGLNVGTILRCSASGSVQGHYYVGGLVGCSGDSSNSGQNRKCMSLGQVSGASYVGGLVGRNLRGPIEDSYAWGSVTVSTINGGGLVGLSESTGTVTRCYSKGLVGGLGTGLGGLIGKCNNTSTVTNSFWDTSTSGQSSSNGGIAQTSDQMKQISTFTSAGWDLLGESTNGTADTWRMCSSGVDYPHLTWERPAADLVCPDGVTFGDFAAFASSWMQTGPNLKADFDSSGVVDGGDLSIFISCWLW